MKIFGRGALLVLGASLLLCFEPTAGSDVRVNKEGFKKGFEALASHVPDVEIFNEELPVIGVSINDLISYDGGSGIKGYLRQILVEQVMEQLNDNEIVGYGDDSADVLVNRLNSILGIDSSKACGPVFKSTAPIEKETRCNSNGRIEFLDRHNPDCGAGHAMTGWKAHNCNGGGFQIQSQCQPVPDGSVEAKMTKCDKGPRNTLEFLDRFDVKCGDGQVMQQWFMNPGGCEGDDVGRIEYKCVNVVKAQCDVEYTECNKINGEDILYLDRHDIKCHSERPLLKSWKLEPGSCGDGLMRVRYECCAIPEDSREDFRTQTQGKSGFQIQITDNDNGFVNEMDIDFCIGFSKELSLTSGGAFDLFEEALSIEADGGAKIAVNSYLKFGGGMKVYSAASSGVWKMNVEAGMSVVSDAKLDVGLGMLSLESKANVLMFGKYALRICNTNSDYDGSSCSLTATSLVNKDSSAVYKYYMTPEVAYKVEGDIRLAADSRLEGLNMGTAGSFKVQDLVVFDREKKPEVTITGLSWKDLSLFSPSNAVNLLRLIDSALTRVQENEAVAGVRLPLVNKKLSDVLATGSIVTSNLNELFVKIEDFDDRAIKSLIRSGKKDFEFPSSVSVDLDLILIRSDLNVNTVDYSGLKKLAESDTVNKKCTFSIDSPDSASDLLGQMKSGIEKSCSLKVCDASEMNNFFGSKFKTDYLNVGRLKNRKAQTCLDPEGDDGVGKHIMLQSCGEVANIYESDVFWKQEKETGEIHNMKSGECLDVDGTDGTNNFVSTAKCVAKQDDMKWDIEYLNGDKTNFILRNRANREQCLFAESVSSNAKSQPCDYKDGNSHWYWERPADTEKQCFKTTSGDYAFCDCDIVVGVDESNIPFLATTAYIDTENSAKNDIRLLALMETTTPTKVANYYGFEVNGASTPSFVPRFTNWEELTALVNKSIQKSLQVEGLTVNLKYVPSVSTTPARVELDLGFDYKISQQAKVDTSIEIGDLADISVDSGELSVESGVSMGTSLAVVFGCNQVDNLVVTMQPPPCTDSRCDLQRPLNYKLEYQYVGSETTEIEYGKLAATSDKPSDLKNDPTLGNVLSSVEEKEGNMLVLRFRPNIQKVKITPEGRVCLKRGTTDETKNEAYDCPDGYSFKQLNKNYYGLEDVSQKKIPFEIAVGETNVHATLGVHGAVSVVSNIGGVIEATANVNADFSGTMELKVNPKERSYVGFSEWLADISAIKAGTRNEGFFQALAQFQGSITGSAAAAPPFDGLEASFKGTLETYSVDFLASDALANKPKFNVDVQLPTIGNIKDMSFEDIVNVLEKSLEFLVGDEEDKDEALKSCSGGLLGKEIAGEKVFQYPIPLIGLSACKSAGHLKTFVTTVNNLVEESKTGANSTFSALDNKLTTLLTDAVGGEPSVTITPSDNAQVSNLDVEIVLAYSYQRSDDLVMNLEEILESYSSSNADSEIISGFTNGLVPKTEGAASMDLEAHLTLTLSVGLEYDKAFKTVKPYLRGSTGLEVTFFAESQFSFDAVIGPLQAYAKGGVKVGGSSKSPLKLSAGLMGDASTKHYITDSKSIANLGKQVELSFEGSVNATLDAAMDELFFPTGVPKIEGTVVCSDLNKAIKGESGGCVPNFKTSGPASLKMPSIFDIVLKDPQALVDAVDDVFDRVERASLGPDGIITNFPAPMIQKGLGDALGAGKEDNIIAEARKSVVQALQERLDGYDKDEDGNAPGTVADVLAQEMQRLLDNDSVDLIAPGKTVTVTCYTYDEETMKQTKLAKCSEGDPTSLMWTVPFGQEYTIELDLDFSLDAGSFPLAMELSGNSKPTLSISWEFTLGFGFDEKKGAFLSTEVENVATTDNASELQVQAWFTLEDKTLDARLFFLTASMNDLNMNVAAGFFIDIVKPTALDGAGPMKGRLCRSDLRKLNRASDLFKISAVAGATIKTKMTTGVDLGSDFADVAKYIPKLQGDIAVQARKEFSMEGRRRLVSDFDRRRLGKIASKSSHPAAELFRWLAEDEDASAKQILQHNFGSNWAACPVSSTENLCAVLTDVKMDVKSIRDAIIPITQKFVNKEKNGYLDKVVEPFLPLNEPIPGISDLSGDRTSILDFADLYEPKSGAKTVKRVLQIHKDISTFLIDLEAEGYIDIADKCDMLKGFECTGGDDAATARNLEEEQESPLIMLRGTNKTKISESYSRSLATSSTTDCNTITSMAKRVACKANKVEGLSFPFLKNPKDAIKLLMGKDISLVEFTPPEITFAFYKEIGFLLYPSPAVTLSAYFEFSARFKYGLAMDTKGIREACTQSEPLKALNSFALMDTFDGVDEPLLTMTAAVGFELAVSAAIARVSVSGGVQIVATIDLFDPYPDTSEGLIRPYEMLSVSLNPIDWLEFSISMNLELALSIKVGLFVWIYEIVVYEKEMTWSVELVAGSKNTPDQPIPIVDCNTETREMILKDPGQLQLACTGLEGEVGNEKIECILDEPETDEDPIQNCPMVSKLISESSSGIGSLVLRGIKTHMDINNFGTIDHLQLNYAETLKVDNNLILIGGSNATVGSSIVDFASVTSGSLILPNPELSFLKTTVAGQCNTEWLLQGYTNLEVKAAQINSNCYVTAPGGVGASDLVIDFDPPASSSCGDGNHITVSTSTEENDDTLVTIRTAGATANTEIKVGKHFNNIVIKMTNCKDTVEILKTADSKGTVSVTTNGGDNTVVVGSDSSGTDKIFKKVIVRGGDGKDTLIVNDSGGRLDKPNGQLRSQTLSGLLNGAHDGKQSAKCSLAMFEGKDYSATDGKHCYEIKFGADGYFKQDADNTCSGGSSSFSADYTVGTFKYQDTTLNKAYYEKGTYCGDVSSDRQGSISLVTDDSIQSPTISVSEPSTCVYEAVFTVPSSACSERGSRERREIEFVHIDDLQIKLSGQENVFHVAAVPPFTTTQIVGKNAASTKVYVDEKSPNLSMKGVTESASGSGT